MAKLWKKLNKTFLTLLALIGVFFAGCLGVCPATTIANATWCDDITSSDIQKNFVKYNNTAMFLEYADDVLVAVDTAGEIYRSTDGTANLIKTGVNIGAHGDIAWKTNFMINTGERLAYKNGILVLSWQSGNDVVTYYSTDKGMTWTRSVEISSAKLYTIISSDELFVQVILKNSQALIYTTTDPTSYWDASQISQVDEQFKFNNGYYLFTENNSVSNSAYINVSSDLTNWVKVPYALSGSYESISRGLNCFYINNTLYCSDYDNNIYKTTSISSNAVWQKVGSCGGSLNKVKTYSNGIIASVSDGSNAPTAIQYLEINESISNTDLCLSRHSDLNGIMQSYSADAIAIGNNNVCVGHTGVWTTAYNTWGTHSEPVNTYLWVHAASTSHTVIFKDYNGVELSKTEVSDGDLALAPSNPSRTGYTFTGWDRDLSEPITEDTIINAVYKINQQNVYFKDYNGRIIKTIRVNFGDTINPEEIPAPIRDGFSFAGWDKDTASPITTDVSFIAQYTRDLTLTINYLEPAGTIGTVNQFIAMQPATKVFNYTYGDEIATDELNNWYKNNILAWQEDYTSDNVWDYQYKLNGWDKTLPSTIINNLTVSAVYEKLNTVSLVYYSQLRFLANQKDGVDYYYTFIGYMTIDRLMVTGETVNLENFKNPDVNYNIYNASRNTFYNNLEYFEFLGWDRDLTVPITQDTIITGSYNMPTIESRLFDADGYYIGATQQKLSFMTLEDMQALEGSASTWSKIREGFRLFFSLQWGDLGAMIADQIDLSAYLKSLRPYHNASCQLLTAFVCVDTDYPEYGGIFKNGLVATSSPVLQYYTGTANENNMSFWINPIVFATDLYKLTVTVNYSNVLTSAVKTITEVATWVGSFVSDYWWVIVLVALLIIFRKPLIAGLGLLFKAIGSGVKSLSNKAKKSKVNSEYKKAEREYTAVKKESKHKE